MCVCEVSTLYCTVTRNAEIVLSHRMEEERNTEKLLIARKL